MHIKKSGEDNFDGKDKQGDKRQMGVLCCGVYGRKLGREDELLY